MQVEHGNANDEQKTPSIAEEIKSWVKVLLVALMLGLMISYVIKPTIVSGSSMYPSLEDKDYLMLNRLAYKVGEPQHKDIVVFETSFGEIFIKRVIGIEGDKVKVKDGKVWVNGVVQEENYINGAFSVGDIETTVPKGHLFVMGDNRDNSLDSRFEEVGFVSEDEVIGKVFIQLFPSISFPE